MPLSLSRWHERRRIQAWRLTVAMLGCILGAVVAIALWESAQRAIASGANANGVKSGVFHLMFFVGLPWSIVPILVSAALVYLGVSWQSIAPICAIAMPAFAGLCWGYIVGSLLARWRRRDPFREQI